MPKLSLTLLPNEFSIIKLPPTAAVPAWALEAEMFNITRVNDELSLVVPTKAHPTCEDQSTGWRALKLMGPFDFALSGILASVLVPLAEEKIGIFAISTFNTDYVMVKAENLEKTVAALRSAAHEVII